MFGIDIILLAQAIGYTGIFTVVFAESGVFFAPILPGASLLFTAGLLASQGFFNIGILLPLIITAAIAGDAVGYWFGAWVGPKLFAREDSRFFKKQYLEKTKHFYEKYGTRTILFSRFVPIVRTFAPILAGIGGMEYRTFFLYNVAGAVLWGGGFTFGGYFLGEVVPGIESYIILIVLLIVVVSCMPLLHEWWKHNRATQTPPPPPLL